MPGQFKNTGTNPDGKLSLINVNNAGNAAFIGPPPIIYTIGETALGGVIAYINGGGSSGISGFVATLEDINTVQWGCVGTLLTGCSGTAIGTGAANTAAIVAQCPTAGIAARVCNDLNYGGYTDWYMPSNDELTALYTNRAAIGGMGDTVSPYLSSTQYDEYFSWSLLNGILYNTVTVKSQTTSIVRPIRSFVQNP